MVCPMCVGAALTKAFPVVVTGGAVMLNKRKSVKKKPKTNVKKK